MTQAAKTRFNDDTPEGRELRLGQAFADAEIEGIKRDPEGEALLRELQAQGMTGDDRRARLKAYLQSKEVRILAAE